MMMMGSIYGKFLNDYTKGHYWLSMCRDFNPHQIECSMGLVSLYYASGALQDALVETEKLFKTKYENRAMLNHYKSWDCEMPRLGVRILGYKHHFIEKDTNGLSSVELKYMLLLYNMVNSNLCRSYNVYMEQDNEALFKSTMSDFNLDVAKSIPTQDTLCSDSELQHYIIKHGIKLHCCKTLQHSIDVSNVCAPMFFDHSIHSEEFHGASNLYDMVHSVYGGMYICVY